eukprot:gene9932-20654_t
MEYSFEANSCPSKKHDRPWRKVLYEKQGYPDNFVDDNRFLEQLDVSTRSSPISLKSVLLHASLVAQQLAVVVIFLALYLYTVRDEGNGVATMWRLVSFDGGLLVSGYGLHCYLDPPQIMAVRRSLYSLAMVMVCLRVAAPLLQTLTSSYSSDTIHALTIVFATVHLVSFDYAYVSDEGVEETQFCGTLSLNAAMFTALLLASRLSRVETVVAFVFLAVVLFSLFPMLARTVWRRSQTLQCVQTICLWLLASSLLFSLEDGDGADSKRTLFTIYEILMVFLWLLGPLGFLGLQKFRKAMTGPWDIAELEYGSGSGSGLLIDDVNPLEHNGMNRHPSIVSLSRVFDSSPLKSSAAASTREARRGEEREYH